MALWQFDLMLTPNGGAAPVRSDDGWIVDPISVDLVNTARNLLQQRLGEPWLMMDGWLVFGAEKGNRVDILFNEDGTGEISVRVDANLKAPDLTALACELAATTNCDVFCLEKGEMLNANPSSLRQALANSRAAAFVVDPKGYIERVANEG